MGRTLLVDDEVNGDDLEDGRDADNGESVELLDIGRVG